MSEEFLAEATTAGLLVKSELVSEAAGAETVPTGGEARGAVMSEEFLAEATTAGLLVKSELVSEAAGVDARSEPRVLDEEWTGRSVFQIVPKQPPLGKQ